MTSESINEFGLTNRNIYTIRNILKRFAYVDQVYIFGSRAMGTFTHGSDLDLAIKNDIDHDNLMQLAEAFDESDLPMRVDVLRYNAITNPDLKDHIDRVGIRLQL